MNFNGLRIIAQRLRVHSSLVRLVKNARTYSIAVNQVKPISYQLSSRFSAIGTRRCYSDDKCAENKFVKSCIAPNLVATYDDIEALPKHPEVLLIDVRRPEELAATGVIPTSINIPLNVVKEELQLEPEVFEAKYGREKPALDTPIIFSCRSGVRAGDAANIADKLGYTNVKNYVGSWLEYAERKGLPTD